jgi:acyl-CoA-binding protein
MRAFPPRLEESLQPFAGLRCYHRRADLIQHAEETTMSDVNTQFAQAQQDVQQLPERPGNLTLLRLYALFKQASEGDVHGDKPGFTDIVGKYKYEAWAALQGTAQETAMQQYVELVESLKSGATS